MADVFQFDIINHSQIIEQFLTTFNKKLIF